MTPTYSAVPSVWAQRLGYDGLLVIAAVPWGCFAVDRVVYPRFQVQGWLPMRLTLTSIASAGCIAGAARLYSLGNVF